MSLLGAGTVFFLPIPKHIGFKILHLAIASPTIPGSALSMHHAWLIITYGMLSSFSQLQEYGVGVLWTRQDVLLCLRVGS